MAAVSESRPQAASDHRPPFADPEKADDNSTASLNGDPKEANDVSNSNLFVGTSADRAKAKPPNSKAKQFEELNSGKRNSLAVDQSDQNTLTERFESDLNLNQFEKSVNHLNETESNQILSRSTATMSESPRIIDDPSLSDSSMDIADKSQASTDGDQSENIDRQPNAKNSANDSESKSADDANDEVKNSAINPAAEAEKAKAAKQKAKADKAAQINKEFQQKEAAKAKRTAEENKLADLKKKNMAALMDTANALNTTEAGANSSSNKSKSNASKSTGNKNRSSTVQFRPPTEANKRSTATENDLIVDIMSNMDKTSNIGKTPKLPKSQRSANSSTSSINSQQSEPTGLPNAETILSGLISSGIVSSETIADMIMNQYGHPKTGNQLTVDKPKIAPQRTWLDTSNMSCRPKSPNIFEETFNTARKKLPMPRISKEAIGEIRLMNLTMKLKKIDTDDKKLNFVIERVQNNGSIELQDRLNKIFQAPKPIENYAEFMDSLQKVELVAPEDVVIDRVNEADLEHKDYLELLGEIKSTVGETIEENEIIRIIVEKLPKDVTNALKSSLHTIQIASNKQVEPAVALELANNMRMLNETAKRKSEQHHQSDKRQRREHPRAPYRQQSRSESANGRPQDAQNSKNRGQKRGENRSENRSEIQGENRSNKKSTASPNTSSGEAKLCYIHQKHGTEAWACYAKRTCPLANQLAAKPERDQPN